MESLLNNNNEDLETPVSMPEGMDNNVIIDNEYKEFAELEERKNFFMNPENQAEILMQNYLMSNPDMILSGKQKRNLRREFLKNAKKGKYRRIFEAQAGVPSEKTRETFEKINA